MTQQMLMLMLGLLPQHRSRLHKIKFKNDLISKFHFLWLLNNKLHNTLLSSLCLPQHSKGLPRSGDLHMTKIVFTKLFTVAFV